MYREGLIAEYGSRDEPEQEGPSEEALADLEARGIRVIRKG